MNKYYVGAKHIGSAIRNSGNADGYCHATMNEAIEAAKDSIREGNADCLVIVKIIAIVRREIPIIVEDLV